MLLSRDGSFVDFRPDQATDYRKTSVDFRPYPIGTMSSRLQSELGSAYEVHATRHFIVACPRGERDRWAERFEEMYRSFVAYFSVRGFSLREPEFPLVAIVWKRKEDFQRYAVKDGSPLKGDVLGYYSLASNRVTLYDVGNGKATTNDWQQNAATVLHEAAHQTAFNTGIHNRLAPPPRWVAEGLGTMFEARGVWNSRTYTNQSDRINRERLAQFRAYVKTRRKSDSLPQLIASNRIFDTDSAAAYSECWALTFYLVETQPRLYAKYLARTATAAATNSVQRTKDFTDVFGTDFRMLDARFLRFIDGLK